ERPTRVLGCEVWRALDWMVDSEKVAMPVSARPELAQALNEVFATQIVGGKRYDLAVLARRAANATFHDAHASDTESALQWAMDLTPLIQDDTLDVTAFTLGFLERLQQDVAARLRRAY
ncbi:MAG: PIG-L family deacetylase, partial [Proteobacteria bacterium]|nr:PIG-L family deacetylase [Pseudomonadota bacterium]